MCELTDFESDKIQCYIVTGKTNGDHMWNIVTMDDGKNYLVDVTNCDEGSSGSSDKLFLKSATEITKGKAYKCNNITYTYDNDQVGLYSPGGDELVLSNTDYVPRTLTKIEVTTQPTKTAYTVGETFDPAGMVVLAVYNRREGSPDETEAPIIHFLTMKI